MQTCPSLGRPDRQTACRIAHTVLLVPILLHVHCWTGRRMVMETRKHSQSDGRSKTYSLRTKLLHALHLVLSKPCRHAVEGAPKPDPYCIQINSHTAWMRAAACRRHTAQHPADFVAHCRHSDSRVCTPTTVLQASNAGSKNSNLMHDINAGPANLPLVMHTLVNTHTSHLSNPHVAK